MLLSRTRDYVSAIAGTATGGAHTGTRGYAGGIGRVDEHHGRERGSVEVTERRMDRGKAGSWGHDVLRKN